MVFLPPELDRVHELQAFLSKRPPGDQSDVLVFYAKSGLFRWGVIALKAIASAPAKVHVHDLARFSDMEAAFDYALDYDAQIRSAKNHA